MARVEDHPYWEAPKEEPKDREEAKDKKEPKGKDPKDKVEAHPKVEEHPKDKEDTQGPQEAEREVQETRASNQLQEVRIQKLQKSLKNRPDLQR